MPSWAHWPRAMLLSELRREQGRPAHGGGGKRSLNPGRVGSKTWFVAPRNGWEGTEWNTSLPEPPWGGSSAAQMLTLLLGKVSFPQPGSWPVAGVCFSSPPAPSLLPTDGGGVTLLFTDPFPWLCLRQEAVRDLPYPSSLRAVHHPWSKGPGLHFLSQLRGRDQCSCPSAPVPWSSKSALAQDLLKPRVTAGP